MDILLVARDTTWGGSTGDSIHLQYLVSILHRKGHSIRLIARGGPPARTDGGGLGLHLLRNGRWAFAPMRTLATARLIFSLVRLRRPDVIYSRGFGSLSEAILASAFQIPLVFEVNGNAIEEVELLGGRRILPSRVAKVAAGLGFRRARFVVTVTESLRRTVMQTFGVRPNNVSVVENGADLDRFRPMDRAASRSAVGLPADAGVLCFIGNLAPWQGVDVLLRALRGVLKKHPDCILLVVGSGLDSNRLKGEAGSLGLDGNVRFVGQVPHTEIPRYIGASDVCVAPMTMRRHNTGSSAMKIREYLACGRPVVASRIQGHEALEAHDVGKLVPPEDANALEAALVSALGDSDWRREAGERARTLAESSFDWESSVERVESVLTGLGRRG